MTRSLVDVRLFSSRMGVSRWDFDPKGGAETVREKKCNRCIAYSWPDRCCVVIHGYIFFPELYVLFCFVFLPLRRTAFFVYTVSLIPTFLFELRLFMFLLLVVDLGNLP